MPKSGFVHGRTYAAGAGMPKSGFVQGRTYAAGAGMPKSGFVQGRTYAAGAGMPKSGFTLIELLVVIVIIAILVTLATLGMGTHRSTAIEDEANRLSALVAMAGDEATLQGRELGLQVTQEGYRFMYLEPQPDGQPSRWLVLERDSMLRPRQLPKGMSPQLFLEELPQKLPEKAPDEAPPQVFLLSSGERTPFRLAFAIPGDAEGYAVSAGPLGPPVVTPVTVQ